MRFPRSVYMIQHNKTKRIYVGSSYDVEKRFSEHMNVLKNGKCQIEDMQKDFYDYGEDFSVKTIDIISSRMEALKEYKWMVELKSNERGVGYNYKENPEKYLIGKPEVKLGYSESEDEKCGFQK